jgi:hypothetical protein
MSLDVRAGGPTSRSSKKPGGRSGVPMGCELLTTAEAAAYMRISPATLAFWRGRKHRCGPRYLKVHAHAVRYYLSDLQTFLISRFVEPARGAQQGRGIDWSPGRGGRRK